MGRSKRVREASKRAHQDATSLVAIPVSPVNSSRKMVTPRSYHAARTGSVALDIQL